MRSWLLIILTPILLTCKTSSNKSLQPLPAPLAVINSQASYPINKESGYFTNPITGDSTGTIINIQGDTVLSGRTLPLGKPHILDISVQLREGKKYSNTVSISAPKVINSKTDLKSIKFSESELHSVKLLQGSHLVNSTGDTLPTSEPIPFLSRPKQTYIPDSKLGVKPRPRYDAKKDISVLDVDQGLNSSYVISMLEDRQGNIWLGTSGGGVAKYDGIALTEYTVDDGLAHDNIWSILEDHQGNIWFGTFGGLTKYDGRSFTTFTEKEGLSSNRIFSLCEDRQHNIWIGYFDRGVSKIHQDSITHYTKNDGLSDNTIYNILEDTSSNLWFTTESGGVTKFDGQRFTHFKDLPGVETNKFYSIYEDEDGALWIGTWGKGVFRYDGTTIETFSHQEAINDNKITAITRNSDGLLIFGSYGEGLFTYVGEKIIEIKKEAGLSHDRVWELLLDTGGNTWVGTWGGGVSFLRRSVFSHFTSNDGLINELVWSIEEDGKGNLWMGTDGDGIVIFDGLTWNQPEILSPLNQLKVTALLANGEEGMWIGTTSGLFQFDGHSVKEFPQNKLLKDDHIQSILRDKKGDLWIATSDNGLYHYNEVQLVNYNITNGLGSNNIKSIVEDSDGAIWLSTQNAGIAKIQNDSILLITEREGLINNRTYCVYTDKNNVIWVGTENGLSIIKGNEIISISEKSGLTNNSILSIKEDLFGRIWLGTEQGLSLIAEIPSSDSKKYQVYTYNKSNGLRGLDFNFGSVCLDSKSRLWWGTGKGLEMMDLAKFQLPSVKPKVRLTTLQINEKSINEWGEDANITFDSLANFTDYPFGLESSHLKNHFTFKFSATDWSAPDRIVYSYRLLGLEEDWGNPISEQKADYRNLPPGEFEFQLSAMGESMQWSDPVSYKFKILAPWWQQNWFRGFMILLVVLSGILIHNLRINWLRKRKKVLEMLVTERTNEIIAQNEELSLQGEELAAQRDKLAEQNLMLEESRKRISQQNEILENEVTKRTQEVVDKALELEQRYLQLEQFSYVTAHNLRAPVARLLGLSDLFEKNKNVDHATNNLKKMIWKEIEDLDVIVKDLSEILNFQEKENTTLETINIDQLLLDIEEEFKEELRVSKATIKKELRISEVNSNRIYLYNILSQLYSNAIKFRSTKPLNLNIIVSKPEDYIQIQLTDNGIGFDLKQVHDKLYQPFQRFNTNYDGKGLGLYFVKAQLQILDGTIAIDSSPGKGTCVTIYLQP